MEASNSEKDFSIQRLSLDSQKMKVKVIQIHWKHNVDIIKMNTELIVKF